MNRNDMNNRREYPAQNRRQSDGGQYLRSTGQKKIAGSRSGSGADGRSQTVTSRRREYNIDPVYGIYDDQGQNNARRGSRSTRHRVDPRARKKNAAKKRKKQNQASFIGLDAIGCITAIFVIAIIVAVVVIAVKFIGGGSGGDSSPSTLTGFSGNMTTPSKADDPPSTDENPGGSDTSSDPTGTTTGGDGSQSGGIKTFPVPEVTFKADLSKYEKYMSPDDRDGYLILVNAKNLLSSDYEPANLVSLDKSMLKNPSNDVTMVDNAAKALTALFEEMKANGYTDVKVTNAYRSYSYQQYIFKYWKDNEQKSHPDWTAEQVEKQVLTYSNREGTSEHQSGLCCDMHNMSETSWERAWEFASSPSGKWLIENCWKFGFVLRFPEGKQEQCLGVRYESWHYRYVGRYHAYQMKMLDMCLEEYLDYIGK